MPTQPPYPPYGPPAGDRPRPMPARPPATNGYPPHRPVPPTGQHLQPPPGTWPAPDGHQHGRSAQPYPPVPHQRSAAEARAADAAARIELAGQAKRRRGRTVLIVVGVVLGLFVIIGIANSPNRGSGAETPLAATDGSSQAEPAATQAEPEVPAVAPQVFTGSSDDVVTLAAPMTSGVVKFECAGCSRNVIVQSVGGDFPELFANGIGSYTGSTLITREVARIEVQANSAWTMTVGGLDLARRVEGTAAVEGSGDEVLLFTSAPETARVSHDGDRNFIIQAYAESSSFPDLVANEVGSYEGVVPFRDPGELTAVQVNGDGKWSIAPA